jgi:hypothetical protein
MRAGMRSGSAARELDSREAERARTPRVLFPVSLTLRLADFLGEFFAPMSAPDDPRGAHCTMAENVVFSPPTAATCSQAIESKVLTCQGWSKNSPELWQGDRAGKYFGFKATAFCDAKCRSRPLPVMRSGDRVVFFSCISFIICGLLTLDRFGRTGWRWSPFFLIAANGPVLDFYVPHPTPVRAFIYLGFDSRFAHRKNPNFLGTSIARLFGRLTYKIGVQSPDLASTK